MPTPHAAPTHYHDRPTRALQDRRDALLALPRDWNPDERGEIQAIEAELQRRGVLSIGIDF